jgi:hypothetical protein
LRSGNGDEATGWTVRGSNPEPSRSAVDPTQPPIQWILGFFPVVKRPGRGVYQSPPSLEVKNLWNYASASLIYLHGEHRENPTLFLAQIASRGVVD